MVPTGCWPEATSPGPFAVSPLPGTVVGVAPGEAVAAVVGAGTVVGAVAIVVESAGAVLDTAVEVEAGPPICPGEEDDVVRWEVDGAVDAGAAVVGGVPEEAVERDEVWCTEMVTISAMRMARPRAARAMSTVRREDWFIGVEADKRDSQPKLHRWHLLRRTSV